MSYLAFIQCIFLSGNIHNCNRLYHIKLIRYCYPQNRLNRIRRKYNISAFITTIGCHNPGFLRLSILIIFLNAVITAV